MVLDRGEGGLRMRTNSLGPIKTKKGMTTSNGVDDGGTTNDVEAVTVVDEEEEAEQPLSPGARVFHAPKMNCFIIAIFGIETEINVDVVKFGLKQSLIKHPRFSSKLAFDPKDGKRPTAWQRTEVNMDDHIVVPDLNDREIGSPDQFVEDYVSNLTTLPMELSKPLWELHLLNIKTSDANAIGIFKIHHSVGDGISLISLVLACTRKTSDPDALPSLAGKPSNRKTEKRRWWLYRFCTTIWLIIQVLWNTLVHMTLFLGTALFLKDKNGIIEGASGTERKPKRIVHKTLSLDDIKVLKNALNMTINDVILGLTQAGLSRYLNKKHGKIRGEDILEKERAKNNYLPKDIWLRASLLVNVRPSSDIKEYADMMEKGSRCSWGNRIGYVIIPFCIVLRDDPLDYLREAKATIDKKKHSLEAKCTYASAKLLLFLLGPKAVAALSHRILTHTTMSLSNVVGPCEEISFYGHPLTFLAPTVCGHPQALTIHYQSHADKMTVVLSVDQDVIPDPRSLCDDIEESLRLMTSCLNR